MNSVNALSINSPRPSRKTRKLASRGLKAGPSIWPFDHARTSGPEIRRTAIPDGAGPDASAQIVSVIFRKPFLVTSRQLYLVK